MISVMGEGLNEGTDMKRDCSEPQWTQSTLTATAAGCRTSRVGGGPPGTSLLSAEELRQQGGDEEREGQKWTGGH